MDLSWQEFNANMRGSWNPEEPDRRAFHSHPRDYEPSFQESDGGPRTRDAMNGRGLLPIPNSFPTNRSYPPGFDNSRMSPPGLDNGYRNAPGFDSNRRRRSGFDDNHRSRSGFENGHDFHVQEDSEGGPSELLANEKTKKRKKLLLITMSGLPKSVTNCGKTSIVQFNSEKGDLQSDTLLTCLSNG
jgi:hypothetical protein